jgi:hypothetical protein
MSVLSLDVHPLHRELIPLRAIHPDGKSIQSLCIRAMSGIYPTQCVQSDALRLSYHGASLLVLQCHPITLSDASHSSIHPSFHDCVGHVHPDTLSPLQITRIDALEAFLFSQHITSFIRHLGHQPTRLIYPQASLTHCLWYSHQS